MKGEWAGQPFRLAEWERQIVRDLLGWKREDGTRRYRTAYIEVPRKNGKSSLAAGLALYLLFADEEPGAEVYSAAADRDQAAIVFDLAREMVARRVAGNPTFGALDETVASEGWKIVGLTRLSPVFPFNLLNYAFGVTRVAPRDYILASWIGMMPGTLMYVYIGSLAGSLATLGAEQRVRTPAEWALYVVGLLATVAVTVYVTRIARAALRKRIAH